MNYLCERCKTEFDEVGYIIGGDYDERLPVCPSCGSSEYVEAEECAFCGKLCNPIFLYDGVCDDCAEEMDDSIARVLRDSFTNKEWEWIKWRYDLHEPIDKEGA